MDGSTNVLVRNYDSLNRSAGYQLDNESPVAYGYDVAGRLANVAFLGLTNSYSYGQNGQITGSDIPGRLAVAKGYDGFNRLAGITNSTSGGTVSGFAYAHNALGQRTNMQMHLPEPDGASEWHYQYDAIGQLSNAWKTANGAIVPGRHFGYAHDDIGNRIRTVRSHNASDLVLGPAPEVVSDYIANLLNQYAERTVPAYAEVSGAARLDAVLSFQNLATGARIRAGRNESWFHAYMPLTGNEAGPVTNVVRMTGVLPGQGPTEPSKAARYPGGNDLIYTNQTFTLSAMKTPQAFAYDDDGNLLADGQFAYSWDGENRLVAATNEAIVVRNAYDHLGRRISQVVEGVSTNYFIYDGWNPVADIGVEGSSISTNMQVWGLDLSGTIQGAGGVGGLLATVRDGKTCLVGMDGNGNLINLVDAVDNSVDATYEYGPFGEVLRATGPAAAENPWRFSTRYTDAETGLVMFPARPYSATLGRWLTRDPLEEIGGENLYRFCANNLVNTVDPWGLIDLVTSGVSPWPHWKPTAYMEDIGRFYFGSRFRGSNQSVGSETSFAGLFVTLGRSGWLDARNQGNEIARLMSQSGDKDHRIIAHSQGVRNTLEGVYRYAQQNPCKQGLIRLVLLAPKVPRSFVDGTIAKIQRINPNLHVQALVVYDNSDWKIPHTGATPLWGNYSSRFFGGVLDTDSEMIVDTKTWLGHNMILLAGNPYQADEPTEQEQHIRFRINSFLGNGFTSQGAQ